MKNTLCAISLIVGFLISIYVSLVSASHLLWLALMLIFVVPMILASWGSE